MAQNSNYLTAAGVRRIAISIFVYMSVRQHISETGWQNFTKFCCACSLWLRLGPTLATLPYVMYFRFCGWHHVCQAKVMWTRCISK